VTRRAARRRRAEIDAATGGLQHPLDQITDLGVGQDEVGQLGQTAASDEDLLR
jgi:hypothetical protein